MLNMAASASVAGGACQFDMLGDVDVYLDEAATGSTSTQELVIPSAGADLSAANRSFGCFGVVNNGDNVDVVGTLVLAFSTPFNVWE